MKKRKILTGKHEADEGLEGGNLLKGNLDRINRINRINGIGEETKRKGRSRPIESTTIPSLQNQVNPVQNSGISCSSSASCFPAKNERSAILTVARKLDCRKKQVRDSVPRIDSFLDFLTHHARVKSGSGYVPYHFRGREALLPIVQQLDAMLSSGEPDASVALCGGAQFGKTVLMLNLLAYLVAVRFRNVGYYLPDDDLVAGLVDGKLRPDVLDQIPWLARLLQVGKTLAPTGRAVNRKGAFLCTDGERSALAFMRGLGKIPTSFSMDVVIQDEKDDLPEEHARFLSGRMTASDLRLSLIIGTQRYHGAGQNLAFTEGTQHIGLLTCPGCGARHNPETAWPGVCRLRKEKGKSEKVKGGGAEADGEIVSWSLADAPRLTTEGNFVSKEKGAGHVIADRAETAAAVDSASETFHFSLFPFSLPQLTPYTPGQSYYLACPACGAELDRARPEWHALAPERAAQRRWSYRLSQLLFPDIDLAQVVAAWQLAIRDPAQMNVFCTDRLALPKSSTQTLTPHDLAAARGDYSLFSNLSAGVEKNVELRTKNVEQGGAQGEMARSEDSARSAFYALSSTFPAGESVELRTKNVEQGGARGEMARSEDSGRSTFYALSSTFPPAAYGGLDMGDQCWFVARSVEARAPHRARLLWIEPIAAERVRSRVPELFRALNLRALCVDAGPLRDLSRDLAFALNDLGEDAAASCGDPARNIFFSRGGATLPLRWHADSERWENARCLPVEFTQREGQGVRHKVARTQEGRIYPLLAAHRDESIARVVGELTREGDGALVEGADGVAARAAGPRFLLPTATDASRGVLDLYERHLLAGARQERSADGRTLRYLDKCENHFLLATAYAALAELLAPPAAGAESGPRLPAFRALGAARSSARLRAARSVLG
jgi:hypothetical protein